MKVLQPSQLEKGRARSGYYKTFAGMPRIVREWARVNGCTETSQGVVGVGAGGSVFERSVRECLHR